MFGYWKACPDNTEAAWGARAILKNGYIDLLHDRQTLRGNAARIANLFDARSVLKKVRAKVMELWNSYDMTHSESQEFVLYEDNEIMVLGNTNGSYGYLYLIGYLK